MEMVVSPKGTKEEGKRVSSSTLVGGGEGGGTCSLKLGRVEED